jgi:hypothetical protein
MNKPFGTNATSNGANPKKTATKPPHFKESHGP